MMISNSFLLIFAVAFMGCVLATPLVTRIAVWAGAIDRPDQFRRIHKGATPRLGGLGPGVRAGARAWCWSRHAAATSTTGSGFAEWWARQWSGARGLADRPGHRRSSTTPAAMGPRIKLLGQALAVLVLYLGGVRIERLRLPRPGDRAGSARASTLAFWATPSAWRSAGLVVTMFWFLGCMNIWNLIDGMDGLASGVGLLVSGTLTLVAIHNQNVGRRDHGRGAGREPGRVLALQLAPRLHLPGR